MSELEKALEEVEFLGEELESKIVIFPEKGHYKFGHYILSASIYLNDAVNCFSGCSSGCKKCRETVEYVVDREEFSFPNIYLREKARERLEEIYSNSSFQSVLYKIHQFIPEDFSFDWKSCLEVLGEGIFSSELNDSFSFLFDASKLYDFSKSSDVLNLLRKTYLKNSFGEVRFEAGKILGYSSFGIWFHEKFKKD